MILRDTLISDRISLDKRLLADFYRSRGYADFRIFDVNAELSEEKDAFFISYNIKEGPQFRIGKVKLNSATNDLKISDFEKFISLEEGDAYTPVSVQSNVNRLEENIRLRGYDFLRVKPIISKDIENSILNVEFLVEKGNRVFVERIDISGNTATLDRVVRRQFFLAEGDPFNPNEISAAAERIRALGLFQTHRLMLLPGVHYLK